MAGTETAEAKSSRIGKENVQMKDEIYRKVIKYIDAHDMIAAGDLVVTGVSGGADSVCLLHILHRLRAERPFRLAAVHVNHGLRKEAAQDAAFVKELCEAWEIPLFLREEDAAGYAAEHKISTEEAGRALRYQAFGEALTRLEGEEEKEEALTQSSDGEAEVEAFEQPVDSEVQERRTVGTTDTGRRRIAVAHNAQDRAETMLFHLFRGSGLRGLASIRPMREAVVRPLLLLERAQIEAYLKEQGISWREDITNGEDAYARNRIRHHILPCAEREVCSEAVVHMGELADILTETEDYLARETERLLENCLEKAGEAADDRQTQAGQEAQGLALRIDKLKVLDPVMQKRVLLCALERVIPYRKDIGVRHVEGLLSLMEKGGSGSFALPCGIMADKVYHILTLRRAGEPLSEQKGFFTFTLWERETIPKNSLFYKKEQNIPENRYTKWFDYDKITTSLLLRTREEGDYITIDTALHTQSLKRYLINEKIPKRQRDSLCVLADGSHVLWIPGYRTSSGFCVEETTKYVLEVHYEDKR